MKRFRSLALVLAALALGAGCRPAHAPSTDEPLAAEDDAAAVEAVLEAVLERFAAADAAGLMEHYAEDAVWMVPEEPADLDKEAATAYYEQLFARVRPVDFAARRDEIVLAGDYALARITYRGALEPVAGGEPRRVVSRHLTVLRREPAGEWKIYWDIFNLPPPDGPER